MMSLDDEIPPVAANPLDAIPALTTDVLTTESDRASALKLVADSVAQQRQLASRAVIFHPITLAAYSCLLAITHRYLYKSSDDLGVLLTTFAGLTMACLVGVRSLTAGYISAAEEVSWSFVQNEDGEDDIIIGSRYGDDIIGALVLRLERNGNYSPQRRKAKKGKTGGKGVVRAWTTKLRYRGTGIGRDLLEHTVKLTRDRLGNSAEIGFAAQHANSKMILPEMFNGGFRKTERQAARALDAVAGGSGSRD
ncbi:hypothetical protein B0O99DRAFT_128994 [Bisporella sp. PMI_857]|nr:hypothetical protein B0O99DRAFT_128994 [Bisporella sp. PMI_857]